MRVLHVSTWDVPCGIATYSGNLVRALDDLGVRNDVYAIAPHLWPGFIARDVRELLADVAAQARCYDLVHVQHEHSIFGHAVNYKAAARTFGGMLRAIRAAGRPVVTTFHTEPLGVTTSGWSRSPRKTVRDVGRRWAWRRHVSPHFSAAGGAAAVVHSPLTRRALVRGGMADSAVHVIPHGCLPPRELRLDRRSAKERLGLPTRSVLLTMFGFVGGYKGHSVAVRALARMPERFRLAICGGAHPESRDHSLASVIRLVRRLGLAHRVRITGWLPVETAELYYDATDVCLAPYLDTGPAASGAITWALASGRPIVGSKIPAFQGICREQPCMLLTTPGLVDELAWAAVKLAADTELADRLVAAAGRYAADHAWNHTAAETRDLYCRVAGGGPASTGGIGRCRLVERPPPAGMAGPRAPIPAPGTGIDAPVRLRAAG